MEAFARKKQTRCSACRGRCCKPFGVCDAFTGHPRTVDEIQYRAYRIHLAHGVLYGYDLDDWLHTERELTEAHRPRASTKDKSP